MKRSLTLAGLAVVALVLFPACGSKAGGGGAGDGDNPFAQRKAHIEAYFAAIEGAGDADKALAAGQGWLDANLAAYKANCSKLVTYRQDLEKSKLAKGHDTPFDTYFERVNKAAGFDPAKPDMDAMTKAGELGEQLNSFFLCDAVLKAP